MHLWYHLNEPKQSTDLEPQCGWGLIDLEIGKAILFVTRWLVAKLWR
jgi:hypothetical protein